MSQAFANYQLDHVDNHFLTDVLQGLSHGKQKSIPSFYFFDTQGSIYYDQMISSEEYYPTPCEISILHAHINEITQQIGQQANVFELGSADSIKSRLLLNGLAAGSYFVAIDQDQELLDNYTAQLGHIYPDIRFQGLNVNYFQSFNLPEALSELNNKIIFYPSSHISDLPPEQAVEFLAGLRKTFGEDSLLLIGHDLIKPATRLEKAYNDKKGYCAKFNKNLLRRINRELDANFDLEQFSHRATFNAQQSRMETHLVSSKHQKVSIADNTVYFNKGESILTQCAYKYNFMQFKRLLADAGWRSEHNWVDEKQWFCLQLAKC